MLGPRFLLIVVAGACGMTAGAAVHSPARQALDASMKERVEAMAQAPRAPEASGVNYRALWVEVGLIALALAAFRSYVRRVEDCPKHQCGSEDPVVPSEAPAGPNRMQGCLVEDHEGCAEARARFLARAPAELEMAQQLLAEIARSPECAAQRKLFAGLLAEVGALRRKAELTDLLPVRQMTFALESCLEQLIKDTSSATPSALRRIEGALELLKVLCAPDCERSGSVCGC
jgi:hypothetical protein